MAANKKPRKQHRQRVLRLPKMLHVQMTRDAHPNLALELHLAIVNLIEAPTVAACNHLSFNLCCIAGAMSKANCGEPIQGKTDSGSIAIRSAIQAVEAIVARHDRTAMIAVTKTEAVSLRAAAGKLDDAIGQIPLLAYAAAVLEVKQYVGISKREVP